MQVKTVSLCNALIHRNLCKKLQKVDKGDGTCHKSGVTIFVFLHFETLLRQRTRKRFHYPNLVLLLILILIRVVEPIVLWENILQIASECGTFLWPKIYLTKKT